MPTISWDRDQDMRSADDHLTVNRRVAYYRVKRGLTQAALAQLVGRSESWLRHIEAERAELDRLSLIRQLADALDVTLGDLIGAPTLLQWKSQVERASVPKVRAALTSALLSVSSGEPVDLDRSRSRLEHAWTAYQDSEYHRLTVQLPGLLIETSRGARLLAGGDRRRAQRQAASAHQLAAVYLPKLGETDLAMLAASRGLEFAQLSGAATSLASLYRIVAYVLGTLGEYEQAAAVIDRAITELEPALTRTDASDVHLSVYGMLFLIGSRAAAQAGDYGQADTYLAQAHRVATHLGGDRNQLWTSFGPTNVDIHRVVAAAERNNLPQAVAIGTDLDTSHLPKERRGRHAIETARALSCLGRSEAAIAMLLSAEEYGAEQIRHHHLSREAVRRVLRSRNPSRAAIDLADRMNISEL